MSEDRIKGLEERVSAIERAGYEFRIRSLESELASLREATGEILASVRRIELQEVQREVTLLRDLLRIAVTGGAGGGAVGTAAYALLQVLGSGG
jgi:hypothetical protein